ncbi:hypothetical protein CFOL_v3_18772 [Cephalotus follicularis]|uniref:RVP_2 domain-containing protein n=1 Tax=Cephalotus follicularis TaxID=3775 RepID=A0A1Q3C5D0_CEPFO|nr:hypothetical protein CFOL_v3_18772 [Cephalotus follicularis]
MTYKKNAAKQVIKLVEISKRDTVADQGILNKPEEIMTMHIRPLYVQGFIDDRSVSRMLVDNGTAINILPYSMIRPLRKSAADLISTEVTISNFARGITQERGVLAVELTIERKTTMTPFFVVYSFVRLGYPCKP